MTDYLLRDLDEDLLARLRARAAEHGRSLQAEVKHVLRSSVRMTREESLEATRRLSERLAGHDWSQLVRYIREDRDSR
ncbi:MAG TPA: plasmid stabilization protein [Coriobacteriia bacterium]